MKFDDLDRRMRTFETAHDVCAPDDVHMVARLDGRSFTRLTKEEHDFEAPFDVRFRDLMFATVRHLMTCGPSVSLAYSQSDEISLLLAPTESLFGRKLRKLNSVLAGESSAKFSLLLGSHAAFDCRVCLLPDRSTIIDYFRWRSEDAARNCLSAHCYWRLRSKGLSPRRAAAGIEGLTSEEKIEILRQQGIEFETLPGWQRKGTLFHWEEYDKQGFNPVTGETASAKRRRIREDSALASGAELSNNLGDLLERLYVQSH